MRLVALSLLLVCSALAQTRTRNVVLVTADGLRWQEVFRGIDRGLMNESAAGMKNGEYLRKELVRGTETEARAALMPFLWSEMAVKGVILGNPAKNSSVTVSNRYRVSYPGYSEILTGRAQDDAIRGNDKIQNPSITVLEHVKAKLGLKPSQAALFGSWDVFPFIGESRAGSVFINAGVQDASGSPRMLELTRLQHAMPTPWDGIRQDYVTLEMALDHLRREKPRLLHIALGQPDDWSHDKRYDRALSAIRFVDASLKQIWETVQSLPEYRDRTTLIVTTDHGRGSTLETWGSHGAKIEGAERIWVAALGPDTKATGEARDTAPAYQRDIAPTILALLGLDPGEYAGVEGKPMPLIVHVR